MPALSRECYANGVQVKYLADPRGIHSCTTAQDLHLIPSFVCNKLEAYVKLMMQMYRFFFFHNV